MIEHRHPTPATQKNVLAASGNICSFSGCTEIIFDLAHETLTVTIAHIKARKEGGPRFDKNQSEEENRSFSNLTAMCAKHSKIIDGKHWKKFSVTILQSWKKEHEDQIAKSTDRSWIKPANSIIKMSPEGQKLQFSYWIDNTGRPRLFNKHQLAILNVLMSLYLKLNKLLSLPERLEDAKNVDVKTVLQQEWAKFDVDQNIFGDIFMLMAMAGEITFAEFSAFLVQGNDPTPIIQEASERLGLVMDGNDDPLIKKWYQSDNFEN
jgi:hypothetical protein